MPITTTDHVSADASVTRSQFARIGTSTTAAPMAVSASAVIDEAIERATAR
jgi:hypothetical protein